MTAVFWEVRPDISTETLRQVEGALQEAGFSDFKIWKWGRDLPIDKSHFSAAGDFFEFLEETSADTIIRVREWRHPIPSSLFRKLLDFHKERRLSFSYCDGLDVGLTIFIEIVERDALSEIHPYKFYPDETLALFHLENSKSYVMNPEEQSFYYLDHYEDYYSFPQGVNMEPASRCNLTCKHCSFQSPFYGNEPSEEIDALMSLEFHNKIIDELSEAPNLPFIEYCWRGEPMLNKKLYDMIRYASQKGFRTGIVTNATLLDEQNSQKLIDTGINNVVFSMDAATKEAFEFIREGADYDQVFENILRFKEMVSGLEDRPYLMIRCVPQKGNEHEIDDVVHKWVDLVDFVIVQHQAFPFELKDTPNGTVKNKKWHNVEPQKLLDGVRYPCHLLFRNSLISTTGNLGPCNVFYEENEGDYIGNLKSSSFQELWANSDWQNRRRLALKSQFDEIPICKSCDGVTCSGSSIGREFIDGRIFAQQQAAHTVYTRLDNTKAHPILPKEIAQAVGLIPPVEQNSKNYIRNFLSPDKSGSITHALQQMVNGVIDRLRAP